MVEPITRLLRKKVQFNWGEEQENAFSELKQVLTNEPVRAIYDQSKKCELHTDASAVGIAGILFQEGHPIGYYSRRLSQSESNYTATELECLAVIRSIEHFNIYLEGQHFTIVTDHSALQWLLKFSSSKRRLYKWSKDLSLYTYDVVHRPVRDMKHVDALSRAPINMCTQQKIFFKEAHIGDSRSAKTPSIEEELISSHNCPQVKVSGRNKTEVKKDLIPLVLKRCHDDIGHPGLRKTLKRINFTLHWPSMNVDIKNYVQTCHICQMVKPSNKPFYGHLKPLPSPDKPFEILAMDTVIMGNVAKKTKAKNILVAIDHHSRYVWAKATPTNTAQAIESFLKNLFEKNPNCGLKYLLTDNGTNYKSRSFKRFLQQNNVTHLTTSTYHPQTNGTCEKVNGTIVTGLKIARQQNPTHKWSTSLSKVVDDYNNNIHDVTGFTPSFLLYGTDRIGTSVDLAEARMLAQQRTELFKEKKKKDTTPFIPTSSSTLVIWLSVNWPQIYRQIIN